MRKRRMTVLLKIFSGLSLLIFAPLFAQDSFIDQHSFSFELSELKHNSTDNEFEARAEAEISNINQQKYSYDLVFDYHYDRKSGPYNDVELIEREWEFEHSFERKNTFGPISYTNYFNLEQQQEDGVYTEKYDLEIGIIGLKANLIEEDVISELSFEYIPLFHYLKFEDLDYDAGQEAYSGKNTFITEKTISHAVNFIANFNLWNSKLIVHNTFSWKIVQALDRDSDSEINHLFYLKNKIKYRLNSHFALGYTFELETDRHRERYGYPNTERINRFTLNFNWN